MKGLWRRQLLAVAVLDARRNLWTRQARGLYILAALSTAPGICFLLMPRVMPPIDEIPGTFAGAFQFGTIPVMLFFACAAVFSDLFRRDITDGSLHYWLLSPVRREIVAVGKFLGALVTMVALFSASTAATYASYYLPRGLAVSWHALLQPRALHDIGAYVAATAMAVLAYGGLFFLVGTMFKSPVIPALGLWLWEAINHLLPSFLKQLSVIHYVKALCPLTLSEGVFALSSEPASVGMACTVLPAVAVTCVVMAMVRVRLLEVRYGVD